MSKIQQIQESLPGPIQAFLNWASFGAAMGYVFTTIVPAIVGVLSATWLGCQIWLFFKTKPWRKK